MALSITNGSILEFKCLTDISGGGASFETLKFEDDLKGVFSLATTPLTDVTFAWKLAADPDVDESYHQLPLSTTPGATNYITLTIDPETNAETLTILSTDSNITNNAEKITVKTAFLAEVIDVDAAVANDPYNIGYYYMLDEDDNVIGEQPVETTEKLAAYKLPFSALATTIPKKAGEEIHSYVPGSGAVYYFIATASEDNADLQYTINIPVYENYTFPADLEEADVTVSIGSITGELVEATVDFTNGITIVAPHTSKMSSQRIFINFPTETTESVTSVVGDVDYIPATAKLESLSDAVTLASNKNSYQVNFLTGSKSFSSPVKEVTTN